MKMIDSVGTLGVFKYLKHRHVEKLLPSCYVALWNMERQILAYCKKILSKNQKDRKVW